MEVKYVNYPNKKNVVYVALKEGEGKVYEKIRGYTIKQ